MSILQVLDDTIYISQNDCKNVYNMLNNINKLHNNL